MQSAIDTTVDVLFIPIDPAVTPGDEGTKRIVPRRVVMDYYYGSWWSVQPRELGGDLLPNLRQMTDNGYIHEHDFLIDHAILLDHDGKTKDAFADLKLALTFHPGSVDGRIGISVVLMKAAKAAGRGSLAEKLF